MQLICRTMSIDFPVLILTLQYSQHHPQVANRLLYYANPGSTASGLVDMSVMPTRYPALQCFADQPLISRTAKQPSFPIPYRFAILSLRALFSDGSPSGSRTDLPLPLRYIGLPCADVICLLTNSTSASTRFPSAGHLFSVAARL